MELLTKELKRRVPPLYSQENVDDPQVVAKFFTPDAQWTWYVIEASTRELQGCGFGANCNHRSLAEYDPEQDDVLFFGYIVGEFPELGYFTLSELTKVRGLFGLSVERDRSFRPCRLSEIKT